MATIYKRVTWFDAAGKRVSKGTPGAKRKASPVWSIKLVGPDGRVRWIPGFSDKLATQAKAADVVRKLERGEMGLTDPFTAHRGRALTTHLADYTADLRAMGRAVMYASNIHLRLTKLFAATGWATLADISADDFSAWREKHRILTNTTLNQYLTALRGLCRWCVKRKRIGDDATVGIDKLEETGEVKRGRRALTDDEVRALLAVATDEHGAVYRFFLATGLRRGEVKQLQWGDVRLDGLRPFLKLRAKATKARRADELPLNGSIAAELADRLARAGDVALTDLVFTCLPSMATHRRYLEAASIAWEDGRNRRVDLHALRHTFGSNLARAGVSPRQAQELMRHTDMKLTNNIYTDPKVFDLAGAANKLPNFTRPSQSERARATGTAGDMAGPYAFPPAIGVGTGKPLRNSQRNSKVAQGRTEMHNTGGQSGQWETKNPPRKSGDSVDLRPTGVEPARVASLEPESSASANSATAATDRRR